MKEILDRLRTAFLAILVVIAVALGCIKLMTIQIVNGDIPVYSDNKGHKRTNC